MDEGESNAGAALQFDRAEPVSPAAARACGVCKSAIDHEYYAVAGQVICARCATQLGGDPGWGGALRALFLGAGAALLGTIVWFLITKLTHSEFGLIAIGVGVFVGIAVRKGARGRGGWKYQTLAMALTYMSITASYVPMILKGLGEQDQNAAAASSDRAHRRAEAAADVPGTVRPDSASRPAPGGGTVLLSILAIFALAFASPFLAGASNFMGIIIIGIALYEAWKINKRVPLSGPFRLEPALAQAAHDGRAHTDARL